MAGVSVWNFCFDYVSRALCQLAAVRKRSGSASLWMVRTVCMYWPSSEPVVYGKSNFLHSARTRVAI